MKPRLTQFNFKVKNNASIGECDIYIDGSIVDAETQKMLEDWYGDDTSTSFKSFREEVQKANASVYNVYVNSGGGMITDAMAIHDYMVDLQAKGKTVNTFGRGIIASAATYVLMASENSVMSENSWLMIHNVSGFAWGDVEHVEKMAATLRKFNNRIRDFYSEKTSLSPDEVESMMSNETWMTAEEAKANGFVTAIENKAYFENAIDPSKWMFNNKEVLAAYNSAVRKPQPSNSNFEEMKKYFEQFSNKLTEGIKNLLTNKDDKGNPIADPEKIGNAISEAINTASKEMGDNLEEEVRTIATSIINSSVAEAIKPLNEKITNLETSNAELEKELTNLKATPPPTNKEGEGKQPIGKFL